MGNYQAWIFHNAHYAAFGRESTASATAHNVFASEISASTATIWQIERARQSPCSRAILCQKLRSFGVMDIIGDTKVNTTTYAGAVRDGGELFLFQTVARSTDGDVYVNIFHNQQGSDWKQWKPHASYHASGQHHQKSFGRAALVSHGQQPNANFQGTENVVTMPIPPDEPRRLNTPCDPNTFHGVFEIPINELSDNTQIAVDITELNGSAIITPGATIIRQIAFKDAIPWILLTVFAPKR